MAPTSAYVNFRTCCRLCMAEDCALTKIFTSKQGTSDLAEKIYAFIGIKVTLKDRITTSVCDKCLLNLNNYDHFKNVSLINQVKLCEQLSIFDARILHEIINIKEEVESDDDVVYVSNELSIKIEPFDGLENVEVDEQPPILSPNLPTMDMLRNLDEPPVETIEIVEDEVETIETIDEEDTAPSESLCVPEDDPPIPSLPAAPAEPPPTPNIAAIDGATSASSLNDSRDKIDFAAVLQLAKKMDSINMEPFTRTEIQYERRMQVIYSQMMQMRCGCHDRAYPSVKRLNSHLRSKVQGNVYLPSFTCTACCTTYNASCFKRHRNHGCAWPTYAKMRAVSNATERAVSKHRNYQAFKCALCGAAARLLETFVEHIDEHLHFSDASALTCHCGKKFDAAPAYRQHLLSACVMKPCCDMCDVDFESAEQFRAHCAEVHDDTDGEQFEIIREEYNILELPFTPQYACVECNLKCTQEMFLVEHLRTAHGYDMEAAKRVGRDCYIGTEESPEEEEEAAAAANANVPELEDSSRPEISLAADPDIADDSITADVPVNSMTANVPVTPSDAEVANDSTLANDVSLATPGLESGSSFMRSAVKRHPGNTYECQICYKVFTSGINIARHLKLAHLRAKKPASFKCGNCPSTFSAMVSLQSHLLADHLHRCKECGKKCESLAELEKHRIGHLKISLTRDPDTHNYRRSSSSRQSADEDDAPPLLTAGAEEHLSELKVLTNQCKLCKRMFVTARGMSQHIRRAHANAVLKRDDRQAAKFPQECGKPFCRALVKSAQEWAVHMRMHAETDESDGESRDSSRSSNTDSDYFTCKKCFKVFSNKGNLQQHMRTHRRATGSPPKSTTKYYCRICKTICQSQAAYVEHKQSHLVGGGKDKCKYCKVAFADAAELDAHMQSEHGALAPAPIIKTEKNAEKKFECELCSRRFATAHGLSCHMAWHRVKSTNVLVRAAADDAALPTLTPEEDAPGVLENAKKVVIRENTFVCISCGAFFPSTSHLRQHVQSAHACKVRVKTEPQLAPAITKATMKSKRGGYEYCKQCGAEFCEEVELQAHMADEHPTIIYVPRGCCVCPICGQKLGNSAALSSHVRMHQRRGEYVATPPPAKKAKPNNNVSPSDGTFKFNCLICGAGYDLGSDLRRHIFDLHPVA